MATACIIIIESINFMCKYLISATIKNNGVQQTFDKNMFLNLNNGKLGVEHKDPLLIHFNTTVVFFLVDFLILIKTIFQIINYTKTLNR